jgi:hypothetical protein
MHGHTIHFKNLVGDFYRIYRESPLLVWAFMILLGIISGAYAGSAVAWLMGY